MDVQAGNDEVEHLISSRRRRPDHVDSIVIAFAAILIIGAGVAAWTAVGALDSTDIEPLKATVEVVAAESSVVTDTFLREAESVGTVVARSLDPQPALVSDESRRVMQLLVNENEAIDGIFVGYADGGFAYVTKSLASEPGGLRVKVITDADLPTRSVVEHQLDASLVTISSTELPDDDYDPRERPWYQGAASAATGWTAPYSFASSGEQGITFFRRHESFTDSGTVLGVDMRLTDVTAFLSARQPGENGVAAIVSAEGAVVAGVNVVDPAVLNAATVADVGDGPIEARVSEVEGRDDRQVSAYSTVGGGEEAWTLVVTALESDFSDRLSGQIRRVRAAVPLIALAFIGLVAMLASAALTRVRHLRLKATIDKETGLATRAETHARLEHYLESQTPVLVVAVAIGQRDLAGDSEADNSGLEDLGRCLKEFALPEGVAGRTGGSEFIVIRPVGHDDEGRERDLTVELFRELERIIDPGGASHSAAGAIALGWMSTADEPQERRLDAVLRSVDLALLSAQSGRRDVVEYDDELQLPVMVDQRLRREFADAMEGGAFVTHFQPEIDLDTGAIVGAEALLRRKRPGGGVDPASSFIADLERLGVLSEVTHTILDHAVDFAARWRAFPGFTIRINLAAIELNDATVMARLGRLTDISDHQWCIELTERTIEQLDDSAVDHLHELVRVGFEIALDDFGTGYSSMAELMRLPITTLKIDRTFVEPLRVAGAEPVSIAAVIQNVATGLGLAIVAEGIETDSQRQALLDLGCERGQGWLMAPALAPNEFVTWAQDWARSSDRAVPGV